MNSRFMRRVISYVGKGLLLLAFGAVWAVRCQAEVVINEIMYHAAPEVPEDVGQEWIELFNTGTNAVNLNGWHLTKGVTFYFPEIAIEPKGYLVVAENLDVFHLRYPNVTNVVGEWTGTLANHGNTIGLEDASGNDVNSVAYASQGDWALRVRGPYDLGHYGWKWFTEADGLGKSLELINANLPNEYGQNWASSTSTFGTPGAPNSVASANIAPLILNAAHFPAVPKSTDAVTVTAKVLDERTSGVTVTLFYRDASTVSPPGFSAVAMSDDGAHGDGIAGDHVYGAVVGASPNGSVIEYYIQATDQEGNTRTWPAAARQLDGFSFAQTANALFQVDDSVYSGNQPIYRIIMTETERQELDTIGRNINGAASSDAEMNGTFVSSEPSGTELRYQMGFRNRGHGSRTARPNNIRVNFANDHPWHGVRMINLNTQFTHSQVAGSVLFQKAGMPAAFSRPVQVRVNSVNLANAGSPQYGSYVHNEELSSEFVKNHWPIDPGGNSYRGVRIDSPSYHADFTYLGPDKSSCLSPPNCYTNLYFKDTNQADDDWTDLIELCSVLNNTADESFVAEVNRVLNVDNWLLYFAVNTLADNRETSLSNGNGDDYAMYRGLMDRRMQLQAYDMDTIFGQGDTAGQINASLFRMTNIITAIPPYGITRFITHPEFVPRYYGTLKRLIETSFSADQINSTFVRALGDWVPAQTISNMVTWAVQRNAFVLSQIPLNLTVSSGLPVVNGYAQSTVPSANLSGRANAVDTRSVRVNGLPADWSALLARWTSVANLNPGINRVLVQAFGADGLEIARTNIDILYDNGSVNTVAANVTSDTTWDGSGGVYQVTSPITVESGATLNILPGTTVFFASGAGITVNGRLLALGTETSPIRFTHIPGGGNWRSVDFINTSAESRLTYVDFEACDGTTISGHNAQVHVNSSIVFIDHCTWPATPIVEYISFDNSSFIVQNCTFPTYPAPVGPESLHGVNGIPLGGHGIFRNNYFGHSWGYNDTIDFTGGNRPGAILQIINNVFDGATDDCLDLDSTDAWIEGNIFMHVHRDPSRTDDARDTAAAISGGVDFANQFSEWTVLNNLFYDVDHVILNKGGSAAGAGRFVFVNNTVVHVNKESGAGLAADIAAFDFTDDGVPLPGPAYGAGAYVANNIIWDAPALTANYNAANHTVIFENNILPMPWSGPGSNNVVTDPHLKLSLITNIALADWKTVKAALTPIRGSPAEKIVYGGKYDGGPAPVGGILVYGEPEVRTASTMATITVGPGGTFNWGSVVPPYEWGYTHYKWKLDDGAWSSELSISTSPTITLTGLSEAAHTVFVSGKNDAGYYQDDPLVYGTNAHVTASRTWTVDTNFAALIINEVLARNVSAVPNGESYPDLIELYNPGGTAINLAGVGITDDPANKYKFRFPSVSLAAGQYLVLFADNPEPAGAGPGLHLGFALTGEGGGLYLYAAGGSLIDSVLFGVQLPDLSIGRMPDGTWALSRPTFGAPNVRQPTGDQRRLKINEWLAGSQNNATPDFLELYNPDILPVDMGGLYLSDAPQGSPNLNAIPALSFIAGSGFLAFVADGHREDGADHLNFKLSSEQAQIGLFAQDLSLIDCIFYGVQTPDVSEGRQPSGGNRIGFFSQSTPGAPNPGAGGDCTVTTTSINLLPVTASWKYDQLDDLTGVNWFARDYNDSAWAGPGPSLLAVEDCNCLPSPGINTFLNLGRITYYFRTSFTVNANTAGFALTANTVLDDGAVIYLNGVEALRIGMPAGTPTYSTFAARTIGNATMETFNFPAANLVQGVNVLAVEVHQSTTTSSDIVWGMALDAVLSVTSCPPASLVLNEVMANNATIANGDGSVTDWVEIHNPSASAADLSDLSFSDDPATPRRWVFPAGVALPAGGYLVVRFDATNAPSTNASSILNTGFGLKAEGERVLLFDSVARGGSLLDSISFGLQAQDFSIGRAPNSTGPWVLNLPTPGGPNIAAAMGDVNLLKMNEWMASPDSGPDWFEIWNPNAQPVNVSGLYLTDDLNNRTQYKIPALSFIGAGDGGFAQFFADSSPGKGANHTNFKLAGGGEAIGLFGGASYAMIDGVVFSAQQGDVSEGRFPDGSINIARFPGTATPGAANLLPLADVVISEVLTHTDLPLEDAIELENTTAGSIDLSGWYLSDNKNDPRRFRIPKGTIIAAGGFAVFYEYQFNADGSGMPPSFALGSHGDSVYLLPADAAGNLLGYRASQKFGASENAVSMGRYLTSLGFDFVALSNRTFGADNAADVQQFRAGGGLTNSGPKVGPIVINEIMYHPPDIGGSDDSTNEFIELKNISATVVSLFNTNSPTDTWRFRDAVDFDFPTNTSIAAGGYLLVVNFSPTNQPVLAAFRSRYGLSAAVPIVGPYQGKLANDSDNIELYKPDNPVPVGLPDAGLVSYILEDKVRYSDSAPWPSAADGNTNGLGASLQRRNSAAYGNDPVNWLAAVPTPGAESGSALITPPVITSITPSHTVSPGSNDTLAITVSGAFPRILEWRLNGNLIVGATNSSLLLTNIQAAHQGLYTVLVSNPGGSASASVFVDVALPPLITKQPQSLIVAIGQSAAFSVTVRGSLPLSYQWQKNGTNLPGATSPTLVFTNVQASDEANYNVVVSNRYDRVTSTLAALGLSALPVIVTPPQSASVFVGAKVSFGVTANGSPPLYYQWRFNNNAIPGATSNSFEIASAQLTNSGSYDVRVTNSVGAVVSQPATLVVSIPPMVSVTAPDDIASEPGPNTGLFTFSRSGSTSRPLTIQFAVSGSATAGGDYVSLGNSITIAAGAVSANLLLQPLNDSLAEPTETAIVTVLDGRDYVAVAPSNAVVRILDDDNMAPSVALTSPADGAVFTLPADIILRATSSDADGTVAKLEFFSNGTNRLAEVLSPYTFHWTNATAGSNVLTAIATDNLGLSASSTPVRILVNPVPSSSFADNFANRGQLTGISNFVFANNSVYTKEPGEPQHAPGTTGTNSAWISWLAPVSGMCIVTTLTNSLTAVSNAFDTVLSVYTGSTVSSLTRIVSNDDFSSTIRQSQTNFNAIAGILYNVAVAGFNTSAKGNIYFRLYMPNVPPTILAQPLTQLVDPGDEADFSVRAVGTPPLSYQWRLNGQPIAGATQPVFIRSGVQYVDGGTYSVSIANNIATVASQPADLLVRPRFIAFQPLPGGALQLTYQGMPGRGHALQLGANLTNWTTAATFTNPTVQGSIRETNTAPPGLIRAYRLRVLP